MQKIKAYPSLIFGKPWSAIEDKKITTVIDVAAYKRKKTQALAAHASQQDDVARFLGAPHNPLITHEYFILRMQGDKEVFMGNNDVIADRL